MIQLGLEIEPDAAVLEPWVLHGDCRHVLAIFDPASVDAVVTDPPYELGFMGKRWDSTGIAFSVELWREVLRVLKPGGHLLAFSGTRTYHRMVCAIEDAGFEIRDQLAWLYGSGFPKSRGALKPAQEPIVLARKPLIGTVAANVLAHGTGGLNVDGCRIEGGKRSPGYANPGTVSESSRDREIYNKHDGIRRNCDEEQGRWPANVLLDETAAARLDAQSRGTRSDKPSASGNRGRNRGGYGGYANDGEQCSTYSDSGGASRFFYVAKASRTEREAGLDHLPKTSTGRANDHPTVKPLTLMRYLVRLITPPGGTVLDPFAGSGTTLCAAALEGFQGIGIEADAAYLPIIGGRVAHTLQNAVIR